MTSMPSRGAARRALKPDATHSFGAQLKALRETAGYTQEELATIAGLSVHAVSALERGQRRRPHVDTVRALSAALDLTGASREALIRSARGHAHITTLEQPRDVSLPLALTALLGRDADVQTLRLWLADPTARLITLTGPGGAGKTRLALELAHAKKAEGVGVIFVGLAAVRNHAFVTAAIAEALGVVDATAIDLAARLRAVCDSTSTLLVLDNFEQVLDAAPQLADLLASVAALRVLVTSRAPLRVRGEREYVVGPLAMDVDVDATSPADLARSPAVRLFLDRVRDVQPDFHLTSANGPAVAEICRRLDALPLALELAAPWLKVLTAEDLCRRLARDVLFSTAGPRDLPERQQTMNATVAWSYQLLRPDEQRVFRRLGALPGRFPIEAAAAVVAGREGTPVSSDKALSLAAGLIDRSLLLRAKTSVATRPLYEMLETVRAYAALELTAAAERDDAMEGLVRYCAAEASLAADGLIGPAQGEWLDRVRDDLESYRGGLTWLIDRDRVVEASDIAWSLFFFWGIRGHTVEGSRWYDQILARPSLPAAIECRALLGAAAMRYTQGELAHVRTALARALLLAYQTGDMVMVARAENLLGDIEHSLGDADAAREHFARGVEGFRALALPWGLGNSLTGMAAVVLAAGDLAHADRLLEEATSVLRHGAPWFLSWTLYLRAFVAVRRGNPDEAIGLVRECLTYVRELRDKFAFVYAMVPLTAAAVLKGNDAWAARILGAADSISERTGARISDRAVQSVREQAERKARERLGPDRWGRSYAAGRAVSIDSLIMDIDNVTATARSRRPGHDGTPAARLKRNEQLS
jgi:predicted ATPase/DNA-binding XRE family transcriptional regulator